MDAWIPDYEDENGCVIHEGPEAKENLPPRFFHARATSDFNNELSISNNAGRIVGNKSKEIFIKLALEGVCQQVMYECKVTGWGQFQCKLTGKNWYKVVEKKILEESDDYMEYVPVAKGCALEAQRVLMRRETSYTCYEDIEKWKVVGAKPSLLIKATQLKKDQPEAIQRHSGHFLYYLFDEGCWNQKKKNETFGAYLGAILHGYSKNTQSTRIRFVSHSYRLGFSSDSHRNRQRHLLSYIFNLVAL